MGRICFLNGSLNLHRPFSRSLVGECLLLEDGNDEDDPPEHDVKWMDRCSNLWVATIIGCKHRLKVKILQLPKKVSKMVWSLWISWVKTKEDQF